MNPSEVSTNACKPPGCKQKPPSMHQIKGEKPCDEMRRKGLGEEPSVAFNEGQKHCGWKLGDVYVLELFCRNCEIDQKHETKRFHAMASDKPSKRSEGRVIFGSRPFQQRRGSVSLVFYSLESELNSFHTHSTSTWDFEPCKGKET